MYHFDNKKKERKDERRNRGKDRRKKGKREERKIFRDIIEIKMRCSLRSNVVFIENKNQVQNIKKQNCKPYINID